MEESQGTKAPPVGDAFALNDKILAEQRGVDGKFESGEHAWLGNRGVVAAQLLFPQLGNLSNLRRRQGDVSLSYGEIVALSGDFYRTAADLYEEKPSPLPWLWESNDLSDLRKLFRTELAWIEKEGRGPSVGYPDNNIALAWNAKSYVELALENTDHFGWHNVVKYCEYHQRALEHALAADVEGNDEQWRRAVYYNGFADHFLTDGFAAGHIRIPRAEIRAWAKNEKLAGGLSKLLHDQDGHISTVHAHGERNISEDEGLPVKNSFGSLWSTRCDGQLFVVGHDIQTPLVAQPVAAVAASLVELAQARVHKTMPKEWFAALQYVPFPAPGSPTLAEKFPADAPNSRIEELAESVVWYTNLPWIGVGVNEASIRSLFQSVPELMRRFRENIEKEYAGSAALQLRLPTPYFEAFRRIS